MPLPFLSYSGIINCFLIVKGSRILDKMELRIKNMVCHRCIEAVKSLLQEHHIQFSSIQLGTVTLDSEISTSAKNQLASDLSGLGFELLEEPKSILISKIKAIIIKEIHQAEGERKVNFSQLISSGLQHDYSYLSRLFSSVEGITIEKYISKQKIEKVKELLSYEELNLSEIAYQLDYSSSSHLSSQFKKETGMTPSEFKNSRKNSRISLDSI